MKAIITFMLCMGVASLSQSCTQDEALESMLSAELHDTNAEETPPSVEIKALNVQSSAATLEGYITNPSDIYINRRGFVYSEVNSVPRLNEENTNNRISSTRKDTFSINVTGLTTGKTVYVRSYIIYNTSKDTAYSEAISFIPQKSIPVVSTMEVFNRVKKAAIACGRFTKAGEDIRSYGVCISRNPLPTADGMHVAATDTATDAKYHGIFGVFFDDLEANTLYHIRAYAITSTDTVYGNDRIFKTTQGGTFNWQFNNREGAAADGAEKRIEEAGDSAMYYFRNYSNLNKFLWINYAPGTPTADCNIEGWMRVGKNARYQWVGTIQHEMCHSMGVGTAYNWNSFANPWDQFRTTLTLRVMMKDMSMSVNHDGMHFWPGGINQQEEVTNGTPNNKKTYTLKNEMMLKTNALMMNAMREDGLAPN